MISSIIGNTCPEDFDYVENMTKIQKRVSVMPADKLGDVIAQCTSQPENVFALKKLAGCVVNPNITGTQLETIWDFIRFVCEPLQWEFTRTVVARKKLMAITKDILSEVTAHPNLPDTLVQLYSDKLLDDDHHYFNCRNSIVLNPALTEEVMNKFFVKHAAAVGKTEPALGFNTVKTIFLHFWHAPPELLEKWYEELFERSGHTDYFWFIPSILARNEKCSPALCTRIAAWAVDCFNNAQHIPVEYLIGIKRMTNHKNMPVDTGSLLKREMYRMTSDDFFLPQEAVEVFVF